MSNRSKKKAWKVQRRIAFSGKVYSKLWHRARWREDEVNPKSNF